MTQLLSMLWPIVGSLIEILLLYYFFHRYQKKNAIPHIELLGYLFVLIVDITLNRLTVESNAKLLIIIASVVIMLLIFYRIGTKNLILAVVAFTSTLVLSDILTFAALSFTIANLDFNTFQTNIYLQIEATLISKGIHFVLLWLMLKALFRGDRSMGWKEMSLTILPVLINLFLIFFLVDVTDIFSTNIGNTSSIIRVIILTILMIASSISIAIFLKRYLDLKQEEYTNQLLVQQSKDMVKHYEEREAANDKIKKLYHDIKNHIICMPEFTATERLEYLSDIEDKLASYEKFATTGNNMLDVLLSEKILKMQGLGIKFSHNLQLEQLSYIKNIDIITIFANAIDNAIEACEKLPVEQRFIKMNGAMHGGMVVVKISNPSDNLQGISAIPSTTKKDKLLHGVGLENIKATMNRYDGEMSVESKDGLFSLTLLFAHLQ